ncbi:MAG: DNA adenine methylase [Candidatus Kapaibacterium sp.]|nr:MAG: DNA adenine methylase [Candidatus Kapabacteria bacterium]
MVQRKTPALITTPLRYPGGKAKALSFLSRFIPCFEEYREPFVGGASMLLFIRQHFPDVPCWMNDVNKELYCFWKCAATRNDALVREVQRIKNTTQDGKALFRELTEEWHKTKQNEASDLDRAVRFFVLNRITFSGTVDSGGYSQKAFESRFTESAIERLSAVEPLLDGVRITNVDYADVLRSATPHTFSFLDPPYWSATASRLYDKRGELHTGFDHTRFAETMRDCGGNWLLTYDDGTLIRENFAFATMLEWQLQYGMNNYKQEKAAKGKELLISNYDLFRAENGMQSQANELTLF